MKPIIGIIARSRKNDIGMDSMICADGYRRAVINSGGIPIMIFPTQKINYEETPPREAPKLTDEEKEDLIRELKLCDGFIFPGGNKIYEYDSFIAEYAYENDIPSLGICLGMQTMTAFLSGVEYRQDVLERVSTEKIEHQTFDTYVHNVKIKKESKLFSIIGKEEIKVNSRHKYIIKDIDYGENVMISCYSEDGFPEGIETNKKKFYLGVQWHPESLHEIDENHLKIFKALINACK